MENLFATIKSECEAFLADAEKAVNGNKAAGARARKASLSLCTHLKEFRKASLAKPE